MVSVKSHTKKINGKVVNVKQYERKEPPMTAKEHLKHEKLKDINISDEEKIEMLNETLADNFDPFFFVSENKSFGSTEAFEINEQLDLDGQYFSSHYVSDSLVGMHSHILNPRGLRKTLEQDRLVHAKQSKVKSEKVYSMNRDKYLDWDEEIAYHKDVISRLNKGEFVPYQNNR